MLGMPVCSASKNLKRDATANKKEMEKKMLDKFQNYINMFLISKINLKGEIFTRAEVSARKLCTQRHEHWAMSYF